MPNVNNLVIGEFQSVFSVLFLVLVLVFSFNPRSNTGTAQWAQRAKTPEETFSLYIEDQEPLNSRCVCGVWESGNPGFS